MAAMRLSVIHGLFKGVRLVTFGFSSLHVKSKALLKRSVKSEKLFETMGPRLPRLLSSTALSLSKFSLEKLFPVIFVFTALFVFKCY